MTKSIYLFLVLSVFAFATSCSKDKINSDDELVGEWKLVAWEIDTALDLDRDSVDHKNLLEEINCENKEILGFESVGTYYDVNSFNPVFKIALVNDTEYVLDLQCSEGSIGAAASYSVIGNEVMVNQNVMVTLEGDILYRYKILNIYNADFSEVIDTIEMKIIYKKT